MIGINNYPMESVFESAPYPAGALEVYCKNKRDLEYLNNVVDTFVVGSDQLFHNHLLNEFKELVYLDWVNDSHKKIAYAASFGHDDFSGSEERRAELAHYIQKYDAFSVREESGVELLKKRFGKEAVQVLDPVFLCEKEEFVKLAEKTNAKSDKPHIYGYILDPTNDTREIIKYASENLQLPVETYSEMLPAPRNPEDFYPEYKQGLVEERLYSLITGAFIICDSFHGACLAMIFNIPFVAILNPLRGAPRFKTLISKFNISGRVVRNFDEFLGRKHILQGMDFSEINKTLQKEKARSLKWLKSALEKGKKPSSTEDVLNKKIKSLETALFYKNITINALLINPCFIREKNLFSYLELLRKNKKGVVIFIAVRDTPGLKFSPAVFKAMSEIGFKTDLTGKHWHSYVAISDGGVVTEIINPPGKESMFENNTGGAPVKLVSKDYNHGDIAFIGINGVDYSMNRRGLNIVVFDRTSQTVVDTVNFDTHLPDFPCSRHT